MKNDEQKNHVSKLPNTILTDIFTRLFSKDIHSCSCVCDSWCKVIMNPEFLLQYFKMPPTAALIGLSRTNKSYWIYFKDEGPHIVVKLMKISTIPGWFHHRMVNSCNGLICLSDSQTRDPIYISNPITGEYAILPRIRGKINDRMDSGLGYCPKTKKFKVVRIFRESPSSGKIVSWPGKRKVEIYTLGTGQWRSTGYTTFEFLNNGVFLNGVMHWPIKGNEQFLCCFDFEKEEFQLFPTPSKVSDGKSILSGVGVLEGLLHLLYYDYDQYPNIADIWLMKKYGVKESWTKMFVIRGIFDKRFWGYHLINVLNNQILLITTHDYRIISYDLKKGCFKKVLCPYEYQQLEVRPHTLSFSLLKNVMEGDISLVSKVGYM